MLAAPFVAPWVRVHCFFSTESQGMCRALEGFNGCSFFLQSEGPGIVASFNS